MLFPVAAKDFSVAYRQQLKQEMKLPSPADGERIVLRFLARLRGEMKVGGLYAMKIAVDGKVLDGTVNDLPRVINRKASTFHGTVYPYTCNGSWNVAANPRQEYIEIVFVPEDYSQVYYYELDITDIPPGPHEFSWENTDSEKRDLIIGNPGIITKFSKDLPLGWLRDFRSEIKDEDIRITSDGGTYRWEFELPDDPDRKAALRFRSRLDVGSDWGYNLDLQATLNGTPLGCLTAAEGRRLLNRKPASFVGRELPSITSDGTICVFHHNSFEDDPANDRLAAREREQAYWCYLDISDLVKQGKNELVFKNLAKNKNFTGLPAGKPELVLDSCEIGTIRSRALESMPDDVVRKWSSDSIGVTAGEYEVAVVKDGLGIQLSHCDGKGNLNL